MNGLIVTNNPTRKQKLPEVIQGTPITVVYGSKVLKGWTVRPYNGEKAVVLHGRNEARIVVDGLHMRDGKLHCRWVN